MFFAWDNQKPGHSLRFGGSDSSRLSQLGRYRYGCGSGRLKPELFAMG
ncbi:MAG: hypothetical protein WA959_00320 [Rivularia sp. (in: cyanobacteria)]